MSQRGKRDNDQELESDLQPPPAKRPPNGSTAIEVVTSESQASISSDSNDNDLVNRDGGSGGSEGPVGSGGRASTSSSCLPEPSVFVMQKPIIDPVHDFKLPNSDATPIISETFEHVMESLEIRCWEQIQTILKKEEGVDIGHDENVICDVCRSPDTEEGNKMVFCGNCNIYVHQACYGIMAIPSGQWLCRTCSMDIKPGCVLCPIKGGAMKSTESGKNWAHVACALWVPEASIGCVDRMEPITKISSIPQSRWALICVLCKEQTGACIQCSVKTCKTAYHVRCAFEHGLEARAIIDEDNVEDGVKLRSYCLKHTMEKCLSTWKTKNNIFT